MRAAPAFSRLRAANQATNASVAAVWPRSSSLLYFVQTLCPLSHQVCSDDEQVRQRADDQQAMLILGQAAVTHLLETEHSFDDAEHVFDLRTHSRFRPVLRPFDFIDTAPQAVAPLGEVARVGRMLTNNLSLSTIGLVAPDP